MSYLHLFSSATRRGQAYPPPGAWIPKGRPELIRLHRGYPFPGAIPVEAIARAAEFALAREGDLPLQYLGSPSLALIDQLLGERSRRRGVEGAVLVTAGIMQGLDLTCRAFLDPGDTIAMEGPTYMEALEIARNYTDQIVQYPVDRDGLNLDALEQDLRNGRRIKLLYVIPSFQNPTGTCLAAERRARLRALAQAFDFMIVEDDAYGELSFGPMPMPVAAGSDRTIFLGSLSKTVAPGLRIGWAVAPPEIIQALSLHKKDQDHPFLRAVATAYLQQNDLDAQVDWLRKQYAERANHLDLVLRTHMPSWVSWEMPEGGFFIWLHMPGMDTAALLPKAIEAGITYLAGPTFYQGESDGHEYLRLSFCTVSPDEMERGVQILARLLQR